ncbi:hypothetical protein QCE62_22885 [Caballeronia sp. LZ033]|uniref:hypothetical protein n=1 Tax=Caballeronia sp. LZ033 TaxID=3038566 RepID=UPI002863BF1A|nr:hypothetical protein [Caballeronia sp. LZ033]MDR5816441.1 hypothetical protein [Caballeronia sp. LZ033]
MDLYFEDEGLRNRRASLFDRRVQRTGWRVEHAGPDVIEESEQVSRGGQAGLQQMFEQVLVRAVLQVAGSAFHHALAARQAYEDLEAIWSSAAPWDEQLIQLADMLPRYAEWLPGCMQSRITATADNLKGAIGIWRCAKNIGESLRRVDERGGSWMDKLDSSLRALTSFERRLPARMQPMLASLKRIMRHADAVRELYGRLRSEEANSSGNHDGHGHGHGRGWVGRLARSLPSELSRMLLEDADSSALMREVARAYEAFEAARRGASVKEVVEALKDWAGARPRETLDYLDTIRRHITAYVRAYEAMSAIMSRPTSLRARLEGCAAYIAEECSPELKHLLPERAFPAIDLFVGLARGYAAARGFHASAMAIIKADSPLDAKLNGLMQAIDRFSAADLKLLPQSARELILQVSQVLRVTSAGVAVGRSANAQETIPRLRAIVEQLRASLPHLLDVLPERSGDSTESVVRALDVMVRQFEALSRLPASPGFEDVMQSFLQDQGATSWLPEFMQPLLQVARQLSGLLPAWKSYPDSGSLADQLSWTLETLQSEHLTDETLGRLPVGVAGIVRPGRVVFLRMTRFPVSAPPVEQAQWLMWQLSEPELGHLLEAGGLPVTEWRRAFISDEHVGAWFDALLELTQCKSWTAAANTVFNLALLSHLPAAALSTLEGALAYVPFGTQAKQILHWVKSTQIATTWKQTARNFFKTVEKDVMHDPAAAFRCLPGATSADLARTMTLAQRLSIYADHWDWAGVLCDLRESSESKVLCDALFAMRLAWSFQALARADVEERSERLEQLETDVRKLHMLGWTGMNTLVHLLPLLPALWELRGQVRIETSGARNWFDWTAAMMRSLADSDTPAVQRLRTRIEEQTEAWVAGALQDAITSVLGKACATTISGESSGAVLTPLAACFARDVSLAGVEEDSQGIFRVDGRCYVQSDGHAFPVKWDSEERAFCLIVNERAVNEHGRRPLARMMDRWWTRRRVRGGKGGGPVLIPQLAEADIDALQVPADPEDILEARGIEYWNEDNQVRLHDFVIASDEQDLCARWKPIVAGVAGGLGLLGVIGYFCHMAIGRRRSTVSGDQDKEVNEPLAEPAIPLQDLTEVRPSEASQESSELLDKPAATQIVPGDVVAASPGVQVERWRPTKAELIVGGLIGSMSLAAVGWASRQAWLRYSRSAGVVDDAVLSVAHQAAARQMDIVIDVPFDASALHSGHVVSRRQAAPLGAAAQEGSMEFWALPRYSEVSDHLTAMVLERFTQSAHYKPRQGDFATKEEDGIYCNAQRSRAYIFIAGRYWRIHLQTAEASKYLGFDFIIGKVFSLNDADRNIFVKRENKKWTPLHAPTKPVPAVATESYLDPSVSRAIRRWSVEEVFHYPDEAAGVEGRLYTHWGGACYIAIDGKYRSATVFHPNLLCVFGGAGVSTERLYLKRNPASKIWEIATVVRPQPMPRKFSDDLIARAKAFLIGKPSVPNLVQDESPGMYYTVGSPDQKFLLLDGLYYKCKRVEKDLLKYPGGSYREIWEIHDIDEAPYRDPIHAALDEKMNWRSLIHNDRNEFWLEDIEYVSIALADRVTAQVMPVSINYPAAAWALLPGKFESKSRAPLLRIRGKLYICEAVTIPSEGFSEKTLRETVKIGDQYASFNSASWVPLQKDKQGKWVLEESSTAASTADSGFFSVSKDVRGIVDSFDPAYAFADEKTGAGVDGMVYVHNDQLFLSMDGMYWPFSLLAPHLGILFGDAERIRMCTLVKSGGEWTSVSSAPLFAALSELFKTGSFQGLNSSLSGLLGRDGFSTWSQVLDALDNSADHEIHESYQNPESENFRKALKLKFQTVFLKSITEQKNSGLNSSRSAASVDASRLWNEKGISQYWTLISQEREAFDDIDFRQAYLVRGSSTEKQADLEKTRGQRNTVAVQLKAAIKAKERADEMMKYFPDGRAPLEDIYWQKEVTRLQARRDGFDITILELEEWLTSFKENVFAAGVAMGWARETAALKTLEGATASSSHWLYGLMYSGLLSDLVWEIAAQSSTHTAAPQLALLQGARLYLETQWSIHHNFSELVAKLARFPESRYWFKAKGDYRDVLSAQNSVKALAGDLLPTNDGVESVASAQVLAALVYHLVTSNKRASSVSAGAMEGIVLRFEQAKRDMNFWQTIGPAPEHFFSLSQIKPSALCVSDTAYYNQFADYEDLGFLKYEAAWITSLKIIEAKMTVEEMYDVKQVYLIYDPFLYLREAYIKLSSSEWMVVRLYVPFGSSGKVEFCEKIPQEQLKTRTLWWKYLPVKVNDGEFWSGETLRLPPHRGDTKWYFGAKRERKQLAPGTTVFSALLTMVCDTLSDTVDVLKEDLYTMSKAKASVPPLPFFEEIYMWLVDRHYRPSFLQLGVDAVMTVLALVPGLEELFDAGAEAAVKIVSQGVRNGLTGAELLRYAVYEAGDAAVDGVIQAGKALGMMILDFHSPVPWRTLRPGPAFKAGNFGRATVLKDQEPFFGASVYLPQDTVDIVFKKIDDEFKLTESQLPAGKLERVHAVYNGSQAEPVASASTSAAAGVSASASTSADTKLWKVVGNENLKNLYLLEQSGNRYLLTFDGARNQYRLVNPAAPTEASEYLYHTDRGWRQSPPKALKGFPYETKPILHFDTRLTKERGNEMRALIRSSRDEGRRVLTSGLETLHSQESDVDKVLDIFMGGHSPELKKELTTRINASVIALEQLRPSTDVSYDLGDLRDSTAVMGTVAGPNRVPPRDIVTTSSQSVRLTPAKNVGGESVVLMVAYSTGMKIFENHLAESFSEGMALTMVHESFHVHSKCPFDWYAKLEQGGMDVNNLISYAGGHLKEAGADGQLKNLSIDTLLSDHRYDSRVKFTLAYARNPPNVKDSVYRFKTAQDVEKAFENKELVRGILNDTLMNLSPKMASNPDSFALTMYALKNLRSDPIKMKEFIRRYESLFNTDKAEFESLSWPFIQRPV